MSDRLVAAAPAHASAARALALECAAHLPVSAHSSEIRQLLAQHQVIIVCGETGSGKTTQLPKILLAMAQEEPLQHQRRKAQHKQPQPRWIGHTQPRRIAATSVAQRLAQELHTPLGAVVGYKVRFQDQLQPGARVKLMTDGVLLAETQSDPMLRHYRALIIDEAHERSLNIDFLLGYLRQLLPRRADLKVIITSATLDADRLAQHFASAAGPAPVVQVHGRSFAVEQRWRPFEESKDYGLEHAVADAVDELWREVHSGGDILVFLPGERDIRHVAEHLRGHTARLAHSRDCEILPLFARLSHAEQERVFAPHEGRRIVLATNVAETALTVPGIRHVIDSGLARIKRYSYRSKVEQLHIEPISQAAARQRAGRCGRTADGICIRLYDEASFNARAAFTDPEILRSSLAAVILRMKALHLDHNGDVAHFPFIDMPTGRAIADGTQLLQELGAVDDVGRLTATGQQLARLPIDPRIARMVLEASQRGVLAEMLIIAAALSVQDARERTQDPQAAAAHALFADAQSEFCSILQLWHWVHKLRTSAGLSARQSEQQLRNAFLNPRRLREWRETWQQLRSIALEQKLLRNDSDTAPTLPLSRQTFEQLHRSLLSGLLGNIGLRREQEPYYGGARGIRIFLGSGGTLKRKPGRWIVAAELLETQKLYARVIATIDPQWIEDVAAHVIQRQVLHPHWDKHSGKVQGLARGTLYGLTLYQDRKVDFAQLDPTTARALFIRSALVDGDWHCPFPFLAHNQRMLQQVQELEHKQRRQDVLVDDSLIFAFYDQHIPASVVGAHSFEQWYLHAQNTHTQLLHLSQQELMRHAAQDITNVAYPHLIRLGGTDCSAQYRHEPGDARDGLSVDVPLFVLNQVQDQRCEWLVPGMLQDKILALLKSLPQRARSRLLPLAQTAERYAQQLPFASDRLLPTLCEVIHQETGLAVQASDFRLDALPAHHFMHFRVLGEQGRPLAAGRNLAKLKAEWGQKARGAFAALAQWHNSAPNLSAPTPASVNTNPARTAPANSHAATAATLSPSGATAGSALDSNTRYGAWDFDELPEILELRHGQQTAIGFPALVDAGDAVRIAVFDEPHIAAQQHRLGLTRLLRLQLREQLKYLEKNIPDRSTLQHWPLGSQATLTEQIVQVAVARAFLQEPLPHDRASFAQRVQEGKGRLNLIAQEIARLCARILQDHAQVRRRLRDARLPASLADALHQQLERLVPQNFLCTTPWSRLQHYPRYLQAILLRLDKYQQDPARDSARMKIVHTQELRLYQELAKRKGQPDARLFELRWLLEELRVSLFAQELKTAQPVSVKRLDAVWEQLQHL